MSIISAPVSITGKSRLSPSGPRRGRSEDLLYPWAMNEVLVIGDPRLRARCEPVGDGYPGFADDVARLARALSELQARTGFGRALAAPQLGIGRRIVAMDLGAGSFVLVDPEV